jgi:hypothetical protein
MFGCLELRYFWRQRIRPAGTREPSRGQRVGYLRVSSLDQNAVRQLEGLALDKTFTDKASGKDVKRPQLEAMQSFVREGDTVFCHSMDRLARNLELASSPMRITVGLSGLDELNVHVDVLRYSLPSVTAKVCRGGFRAK